jgi:hypothetical protein
MFATMLGPAGWASDEVDDAYMLGISQKVRLEWETASTGEPIALGANGRTMGDPRRRTATYRGRKAGLFRLLPRLPATRGERSGECRAACHGYEWTTSPTGNSR